MGLIYLFFSPNRIHQFWNIHSPLLNGYRASFPEKRERERGGGACQSLKLTIHLHLVPWLGAHGSKTQHHFIRSYCGQGDIHHHFSGTSSWHKLAYEMANPVCLYCHPQTTWPIFMKFPMILTMTHVMCGNKQHSTLTASLLLIMLNSKKRLFGLVYVSVPGAFQKQLQVSLPLCLWSRLP